MKEQCDFPAFTAYRLDEDMVHIALKKIKQLTALDVQQIYSCHDKMGNGKRVYVLATFEGFIPLSDDAMVEAKKEGKRSPQAATACVVNNYALRVAIKFFMNFYKPDYPIHISSTKKEAIAWLKQQKKKNKN